MVSWCGITSLFPGQLEEEKWQMAGCLWVWEFVVSVLVHGGWAVRGTFVGCVVVGIVNVLVVVAGSLIWSVAMGWVLV
eukprot:g49367.t1